MNGAGGTSIVADCAQWASGSSWQFSGIGLQHPQAEPMVEVLGHWSRTLGV